ncbi:MAG: M1 family metallopeptidase [Bacteroidia bacterium]|nr:M1 family metallopeptidase [Bacteroidia bacterium]
MKYLVVLLLVLRSSWSFSANEKSYFQQEVNYKIQVSLNDLKHSLRAEIEIEYINHSPDTLYELWFHLWPNAYSSRQTALCKQLLENGDASLYFANDDERGYMDSLAFTADNQSLNWTYDKSNRDVALLKLNNALLPGSRVVIKSPFYVKLPSARFSRLGHIGQAYAITQWYPKPAVYDRYGWHAMPYLDQGEFYSEFGSFDVSITLPENYVVGATGDLQTASEIEWMDRKATENKMYSDNNNFPLSSSATKTIRFRQEQVHDFAWFADKRFHVLKGEIQLPGSGKKVTTWALYTNSEPRLWENSIEYINDAILHYSKWIGDYPYRQCTAVDGTIAAGAGMEYPNITIIGQCRDEFLLELVIAHEVGHNWFYGILGSNERRHPWMDEGINSYYEARYVLEKYPPARYGNKNELGADQLTGRLLGTGKFNYRETGMFEYLLSASSHTDQPIEGVATGFTMVNYGTITYKKTAQAFLYLQSYLSEPVFDAAMQEYYRQWRFKHPYPSDLRSTLEQSSRKNLYWFFNDVLKENEKQDFKLRNVTKTGEGFTFTTREKSRVRAPFPVSGFIGGSKVTEKWFEPGMEGDSLRLNCSACDEIVIDAEGLTLDVNRRNNSSVKKRFPELFILPKVKSFDRSSVYITPVAAWNKYNQWMLGAAVYNSFLPFRKIEYAVSPLYSFGDHSLNGTANLSIHFDVKNNLLRGLQFRQSFRKFSYAEENYRTEQGALVETVLGYLRYSPEMILQFNKKNLRSTLTRELSLQTVHLWEDNIVYQTHSGSSSASVKSRYKDFYRLIYEVQDRRVLDPWSFRIAAESNKEVFKAESELNYRISYRMKGKGADIRVFAGKSFMEKPAGRYGFFLGDRNGVFGSTDYAYDEWYFGRSETEGLLFQQMALRQGQFKIYTPIGLYRDWIFVLNLSADFPVPLPLRFYADIGTTEDFKRDVKRVYNLNAGFSYNAGICLSIARNTLEVYFPLIKSEEIRNYLETNDVKFAEQIRFVCNIARMNPLRLRNSFFR